MDRSSSPRPCRNGSRLSVPRPLTSSGAALGRTATSRASTPAFAMNCSTARSSTLCARPGSFASIGYKPPAAEVFVPAFAAWPAALRRPTSRSRVAAGPCGCISFKGVWEYATCWDVGKAAKDWPQMTFVIYHSALRPFLELPDQAWAEFESTGRIKWATDLAEIPAKFGVTNVVAEIGTSFANSAVAHPKFSAALIGTLVKGFGPERVLWGTDSVWYGSPQWQIEAMRRLEIPEDMQKKYGFAALGGANSPIKQMIFGGNAARLYGIRLKAADNAPMPAYSEDRLTQLKNEYELAAKEPSNLRYGYVR